MTVWPDVCVVIPTRDRPGPLRAAREKWSTARASERCSSVACRSIAALSRVRSASPSEASCVSTAPRVASSSGEVSYAGITGCCMRSMPQDFAGVGDQLVGDGFRIDL